MTDNTHKTVLQEYRDFLLMKVPWDRVGFLQSLADSRVLLKTDVDDLQVRVDTSQSLFCVCLGCQIQS